MSFTKRSWAGEEELKYTLEPSTLASNLIGHPVECGKLSRKGPGDPEVFMRIGIDDLGILAMYAKEAFMESIGRVSLEITPIDLQKGDAIEGLGEIESLEKGNSIAEGGSRIVIATIAKSGTQVVFVSDSNGEFNQLIDITRERS